MKSPGAIILLGVVAAALVVGAIFAGVKAFGGSDDSPNTYMGAIITQPADMPDATLTDQNGKPFDLKADTKGYVTLLYVGYTHCPDICPTHLSNMAQALKKLPPDVANNVKVVFVTSDPARDTPDVLKTYLKSFDPNFIGLTGTQEETDAFQRTLGIPVSAREDLGNGDYAVNHAAYVIAFTKEQVAYTVYPAGMGVPEWVNDLPLLVKYGFKPG
jgi:protein SCO1/2